ncbi:hypothetical protein [Pseudooceanicola sp.]|uniref:hypothetical protein n=1 Tax=Pseudooceanicola sp. TaxID=1914328 RepID=UPI0035C690BC
MISNNRFFLAAITFGSATALLTTTSAVEAATFRTSTYFQSETTDNDNGLTCSDFSSAGALVECSGTQGYVDGETGKFEQIEYGAKAQATSGALKTETSLMKAPGTDLPAPLPEEESGYTNYLGPQYDDYIVKDEYGSWIDNEVGEGSYALQYDFPELSAYGSAYALARMDDDWTITGGVAGSTGTLKLSYHLDGSANTQIFPYDSYDEQGNVISTCFGCAVASSQTHLTLRGYGQSGELVGDDIASVFADDLPVSLTDPQEKTVSIDETVNLFLDFVFGEEFNIIVSLWSLSDFTLGTYDGEYGYDVEYVIPAFDTKASFFNTALLGGITVLNDQQQEIDFALSSKSGDQVFESFSTLDNTGGTPVVPLPAGLPLMLGGLALLGGLARRR